MGEFKRQMQVVSAASDVYNDGANRYSLML